MTAFADAKKVLELAAGKPVDRTLVVRIVTVFAAKNGIAASATEDEKALAFLAALKEHVRSTVYAEERFADANAAAAKVTMIAL